MSENGESSLLAATAVETIANALRTSLSNEGRNELVYANKFYMRATDQPLRVSVAELIEALDRAKSGAGHSGPKAIDSDNGAESPLHAAAPMLKLVRNAFIEHPDTEWSYDTLLAHFRKSGRRSTAKNPRDALRTAVANLVKTGIVEKVSPGVYRLKRAETHSQLM